MDEKITISRKLYSEIESLGEKKILDLIRAWKRKKAQQKARYYENREKLKKVQNAERD